MTISASHDRMGPGPDDSEPPSPSAGPATVSGDLDRKQQGTEPGQSVGFAPARSAAVRSPKQSWRRRLAYVALDAVNPVIPKTPDTVALHSTVDQEDGVSLSDEFGMNPLRIPIVGAARNDRMLRSDGSAARLLDGLGMKPR